MFSKATQRTYLFLMILSFLFFNAPLSANASSYEVIEIAPSDNDSVSRAYGINENGDVAACTQNGDDLTTRRATIWDAANGTQELPTLNGKSSVWELNDNRQVAGYSTDADGFRQAVR